MQVLRFLTILVWMVIPASLLAFETTAKNAYVIDVSTGAVMLDKDSSIAKPPASMSKLMTIALTFKALQSGAINMDTMFPVSQKARNMGGSRMFVEVGTQVSIEDLIQGVVIQSGNDACVVLAEGLAGSEEKFAQMMNARAMELGLENSTFGNSSGWPHPNQRMSAKDLAVLAYHIEQTYPEYFHYFAQESFSYNNISQDNRNPLLGVVEGADGFKTGHTEESGYGLVGSVTRDDRRVIFVLMGMSSKAERAQEAERIATWALSSFAAKTHYKAGEPIATARTWLANRGHVGLTTTNDFTTLVPLVGESNGNITLNFNEPITAPLTAGTQVGTIHVENGEMPSYNLPLVIAEDLEKGGFLSRYMDVLQHSFQIGISALSGGA